VRNDELTRRSFLIALGEALWTRRRRRSDLRADHSERRHARRAGSGKPWQAWATPTAGARSSACGVTWTTIWIRVPHSSQ